MSWIKNKLNKLLNKGEERYEDYEEYEEYDEPAPQQSRAAQYEQPERKASFRFPLITDEELAPKQATEEPKPTYEEPFYEETNHSFALPRHLQSHEPTQVYDVEVSGIRELLERRQRGRGQSTVIRSSHEREQIVTAAEREVLTNQPIRQEKVVDKKFINPLENRKRFVPTNVPSPVHGFNQATPIETLLKQKSTNDDRPIESTSLETKKVEQAKKSSAIEKTVTPMPQEKKENVIAFSRSATTDTEAQNTHQAQSLQRKMEKMLAEEPVLSVNEELVLEEVIPAASAEVIEEPAQNIIPLLKPIRLTMEEDVEQPPVMEQQPASEEVVKQEEKPATEPVQVQHVTIENSTIHIGKLHVDQLPQTELKLPSVETSEELATTVEPAEESAVAPQPKNEGSRLPFNVLMLKSDKQKLLAQQIAKAQFRQVKPVVEQQEVREEITPVPLTVEVTQLQMETAEQAAEQEEQTASERTIPTINSVSQQPETTVIHPDTASVQITPTSESVTLQQVAVIEKTPSPSLSFVEAEGVEEPTMTEEAVEAELVVTEKKRQPYHKPPTEFLLPPEEELEDRDWMEEQGENLVEALSHFQIAAQIESIVQGPAVTQFEITVGHGTKVSKVRNLSDDIKLALAAKDVRIDAPIPGKRSIGIEIPNRISRAVRLSEVTNSANFQESDSPLEAALGLDLTGKPVTLDLRKMPHGLVAGATGSGKSVCINSILVSLLYKADPNELKLMLIDPKMVELAPFNHIPHLVSPVITDVKAATAALKWAVEEMERRYQLFMHSGQRHITGYNKLCEQNKQYAQKLPYMLIVIDELADLMMMAPQDVEDAICRIAQKARACGIHLIIATQRPSVDVITGLIKSNIPTRIAFAVSSQIDSRTILDGVGAERLLGRGDMLYMGNGMSAPVRIQGTFVTDEEIEEIIDYVRSQGEPDYLFQQDELLRKAEAVEEQDELFEEVCRYVYEQGSASTSAIQRRYHIGYNRAARLVDMLERHGFVSEQKGSKPRDVFITETDLVHHFG